MPKDFTSSVRGSLLIGDILRHHAAAAFGGTAAHRDPVIERFDPLRLVVRNSGPGIRRRRSAALPEIIETDVAVQKFHHFKTDRVRHFLGVRAGQEPAGRLRQQVQALVALAQRLLGLLALGDVHVDADHTNRLPIRVKKDLARAPPSSGAPSCPSGG